MENDDVIPEKTESIPREVEGKLYLVSDLKSEPTRLEEDVNILKTDTLDPDLLEGTICVINETLGPEGLKLKETISLKLQEYDDLKSVGLSVRLINRRDNMRAACRQLLGEYLSNELKVAKVSDFEDLGVDVKMEIIIGNGTCTPVLDRKDKRASEDNRGQQRKRNVNNTVMCEGFLVHVVRRTIFISSRYRKLARNVSQTPMIMDGRRVTEKSVSEMLYAPLDKFAGSSYNFYAAGREDLDVRMLGTGRPFVIEITDAKRVNPDILLGYAEAVKSYCEGIVEVAEDPIILPERRAKAVYQEMEDIGIRKVKEYGAIIHNENGFDKEAIQRVMDSVRVMASQTDECADVSTSGESGVFWTGTLSVKQRTPSRVSHRRAIMDRSRNIYKLSIIPISADRRYAAAEIWSEAGMYIKEFVHGDFNRTSPSITMLYNRAQKDNMGADLLKGGRELQENEETVGLEDMQMFGITNILQLDVLNVRV